uniref:hypothetical protein n=1 Tax=Gemmiger formicilis TaxID=745368 RepID=UPI0040280E5C
GGYGIRPYGMLFVLALAKAPHFLLLSFIYYLLIFPFCKAIFEKRAADFTISNPFVHLIL